MLDTEGGIWSWDVSSWLPPERILHAGEPLRIRVTSIDFESVALNNIFIQGINAETSEPVANARINLTRETISIPETIGGEDFRVASFSVDGGTRWQNLRISASGIRQNPFANTRFPRLLNNRHGLTLHISDRQIGRATRQPASDAAIITFARIEPRPRLARLRLNYAIAAENEIPFSTGNFVLTERHGAAPVFEDLQIGFAARRRNVTARGFGIFREGRGGSIAVSPFWDYRDAYVYRIAPLQSEDGTFTAASLGRRIRPARERRPVRPGLSITQERRNRDGTIRTPFSARLTVRGGTFVETYTTEGIAFYANRTTIDITNEVINVGSIYTWMPATERRTRTGPHGFFFTNRQLCRCETFAFNNPLSEREVRCRACEYDDDDD